MVSVEKCCVCFRLSSGGIIIGSFGAFSSLLLILVIGGFLLNYDNFVAQSYEKGSQGDDENKRLAIFLETYKNCELKIVVDMELKTYRFDLISVVITLASIYNVLQSISFVSSLALVCGTIHVRFCYFIMLEVSALLLPSFAFN